jgi:beta-glucosidase
VVTDALLMKAIGDEKQASLDALSAGADILLVPQHPNELIDFLEQTPINENILTRAEQAQDKLCALLEKTKETSSQDSFSTHDFVLRAAQKSIVQTGPEFTLRPGDTVYYVQVGNSAGVCAEPFLNTLKEHNITAVPFEGQKGPLLVLCFRRYQAFDGSIGLQQEEKLKLEQLVKNVPYCACVLFASPWALGKLTEGRTTIYTFSPSPEFQQTAAEILLGRQKSNGTLPVSL